MMSVSINDNGGDPSSDSDFFIAIFTKLLHHGKCFCYTAGYLTLQLYRRNTMGLCICKSLCNAKVHH